MTGVEVTRANENFQFAFEKAAEYAPDGAIARFDPVTVTSTGTDITSFNRIFTIGGRTPEAIEAAVEWMHDRGDPFWLTTTDERRAEVEAVASSLDLVDAGVSQPGMVLRSLDGIPAPSSEASIERVTDEDDLEELVPVFADVFDVPHDVTETLIPPSVLDDATYELLVGRIDGRCVSCGTLLQRDGVAGVYSIATVEDHRGRGIGTDMTWEVLRAGRESGCQIGVLQSSEMGYPVYEKMGFEPVVDYHYFEPRT